MDIDSNHEEIRKEQLEKIKTGNSVFGLIPSEIGEIIFCDSDTWDEKAPTREEATKSRIWTFVISAGIIALFWVIFPNATVLGVIITIVVSLLAILLIAIAGDFSGTDYFIGEEGFLTDKGEFLDRWEAADHAYECGQLIETAEEPRIDRLMSEDLW